MTDGINGARVYISGKLVQYDKDWIVIKTQKFQSSIPINQPQTQPAIPFRVSDVQETLLYIPVDNVLLIEFPGSK